MDSDGGRRVGGGAGTVARLSGMMAGVYIVQGAWWPLLAVHLQDLGVDGRGRGAIFATLAIASLLTPMGMGQVADRLMPAQKLMALLYAIGTVPLALMAFDVIHGPGPLFALFLSYWLIVAPGIGLSNAIAFRNLERPGDQFGKVRLWGTVGWMAVGWVVSAAMAVHGTMREGQGAYEAFAIAAIASAAMAVYCLTLPNTPPLGRALPGQAPPPGPSRKLDLRDSLALIRRPSVGIFLALAFGASLTTPYVYQVVPAHLNYRGLPRPWIAAAMSMGQVLEILTLAFLPRIIGAAKYRGTLALGLLAWVGYFGLLAIRLPLPWGLIGLPVQGLAIALFHIAGPIYLDRNAPANLRASAQGLYVTTTTGLGTLLGSLLAGEVVARAGGASAGVFLVPLGIDAALLIVLLLAFRPDRAVAAKVTPQLPEPRPRAAKAPAECAPALAGD